MNSEIIYEDQWGEIIDRPDAKLVEIRWYDATADMSGDQFNDWLTTFAKHVAEKQHPGCLVDATRFRMSMDKMDSQWRDDNIIPKYNAAGVKSFAFLMPDGMPLIGAPPAPEGPGEFPTGYFGVRAAALDWILSGCS